MACSTDSTGLESCWPTCQVRKFFSNVCTVLIYRASTGLLTSGLTAVNMGLQPPDLTSAQF